MSQVPTQFKPQPVDDISLHRASAGWAMDQEIADELQQHPRFPLLFGVDGRFVGTLRRFRGFRRLDYDIRYPHSRAGYGHVPIINTGLGGEGPAFLQDGAASKRAFAPPNWDTKGVDSIDPEASTIYQFLGGTLSRSRRTEGAADRRPVSAFLIHMLDGDGKPVVKMIGRSIGDTGLGALFQSNLIGPNITALGTGEPNATAPAVMELRLKDTTGGVIDWVGMTIGGRFILLSHKRDEPNTDASGGDTWIYEIPYKGWRGITADAVKSLSPTTFYHTIPDPGRAYPVEDNGFTAKGDKFTRCKLAGTRGWNWLPNTGTTSSDGTIESLGHTFVIDPLNTVPHAAGNQFRLRIRLVNYTTGFVSPMSAPLQLTVGPNQNSNKIKWVPGIEYGGVLTAGAVWYGIPGGQFHDLDRLRSVIMPFFGADERDVAASPEEGMNAYSDFSTPLTIERDGLYDTRIQVWVTQSVPADNPSGGGGYYFLDQEIPVIFRHVPKSPAGDLDLLFGWVDPARFIWPGFFGEEYGGFGFRGKRIPSKGNDELATQAVYIPESDDVGELEPSEALGIVGGALASISDGGTTPNEAYGASSGDIRISPPWQFYPANWIETVAPLFHHRVEPKGAEPPKFVNVGDMLFLIDQNRLVRMVRDGTSIIATDVDIPGGINRDGATGVKGAVVVTTTTGLMELNAVTLEAKTIAVVQRIMTEKWHAYVRQGQIMAGYDPQLKAVFVAPRRALTDTTWLRSEALVLWTTTGRVTMLADVYWCGMTRGVHPVTGKEHLFFIDPAHNITYPDDSLDEDTPATMVGINTASDPHFPSDGWVRQTSVSTITVHEPTAGGYHAEAAIVVDGIVFQEGEDGSWDTTSGTTAGIAASMKTALEAWLAGHPDFNVSVVNRTDNVIEIISRLTGTINEDFDFVSLLTIDNELSVGVTRTGEATSGSALSAGGAFQGTVTTIVTGGSETTITDSAHHTTNGGSNFDLYAWYNPHNVDALGVQPSYSALTGAQVYFFRTVDDDRGISRPALVADVRVKTNTQQTLVFNNADVNYHSGATIILQGDHYCVSPVVFQAVGAPLDTADFSGSGIGHSGAFESLGAYVRNRKGAAASGGTRLPASNPLQGALMFGVATRADLEARTIGKVVSPEINLGINTRMGSPGSAATLLWAETDIDVVTAPTQKKGNSIFPVLTCFGADYQFDLVATTGRVTRAGRVSGERPEGY